MVMEVGRCAWAEKRGSGVKMGCIYSDGYLLLEDDDLEAWIENNPGKRLSVRLLELHLPYKLDTISDSIEELEEVTHLRITSFSLNSLPNAIITKLHKLRVLELRYCFKMNKLPANLGQLKKLTHLSLTHCNGLTELPVSLGQMESLTHLSLAYCDGLTELPASLGQMESLTHLSLDYCDGLTELRASLGQIKRLTHLSLAYCDGLKELPASLGQMESLTHLSLFSCCGIERLPNSMENLYNLQSLHISDCGSLEELPANLKVMHLKLIDCNIGFLPKGLSKLKNLYVRQSDTENKEGEWFANLKDAVSLQFLQACYVNSLPNSSLVGLCNLQQIYLRSNRIQKFPAQLNEFSQLSHIHIWDTNIKCLPWSISKLRNLRSLFLPRDFRLQTLPPHLDDSVFIYVEKKHMRKRWKQLKLDVQPLPFPIPSAQNPSVMSPPGYLRWEGDLHPWIQNNYDSCMSVQILDLDLQGYYVEDIGNFIGKMSNVTHLYISGNSYYVSLLPSTITKLRHLSLEYDIIESLCDSLGDLETLNLNMKWGPMNNFITLSQLFAPSFPNCLEKLPNLKTLELSQCHFESFPEHMNLKKLKLTNCRFQSLPTCLRHLEILHLNPSSCGTHCTMLPKNCLNQLVNLETLSVTCYYIECYSNVGLRKLQGLNLKDCFNLKKLLINSDDSVNLSTIDISGTRIKSLPDSIMKLPKLQHLILPKCFEQKGLTINLKTVCSIDDTDEMYYNEMRCNAFLYCDMDAEIMLDSAKEVDEISPDFITVDQVDQHMPGGIEEVDKVLVEGSEQAIIVKQTSQPNLPDASNTSMGNYEQTSDQQGVNFQVQVPGGGEDAMGENNQDAICSSQNQEMEILATGNNDCVCDDGLTIAEEAYPNGDDSQNALQSGLNGQNNLPAFENGQSGNNSQRYDVKNKNQKKEIPLATITKLNGNMKLEDAAKLLDVSRSTLKRRNTELGIQWKKCPNAKKKHNAESTSGSKSAQLNPTSEGHARDRENSDSRNQQRQYCLDESSDSFDVKATYKDDTVRFKFSLTSSIEQLKEELVKKFKLEVNSFKIKYQDDEKELMLLTCISELKDVLALSRSSGSNIVRVSAFDL